MASPSPPPHLIASPVFDQMTHSGRLDWFHASLEFATPNSFPSSTAQQNHVVFCFCTSLTYNHLFSLLQPNRKLHNDGVSREICSETVLVSVFTPPFCFKHVGISLKGALHRCTKLSVKLKRSNPQTVFDTKKFIRVSSKTVLLNVFFFFRRAE